MQTKHSFLWTIALFTALWLAFYALDRSLPYIKIGSDVVFSAKLRWEREGQVFPADTAVTRVLIFGNSKVLAGFIPAWFDQLSAARQLRVFSVNSGFPGSDLFLPPLKDLCTRGQAPNVLLLTLPWGNDPPSRSVFHFILDDHAVIEHLFPFRNFPRDLTAFLIGAFAHGGPAMYYREAENYDHDVIAQRGYYLIKEQSRFPSGRVPDDFHLSSDQPGLVLTRAAPPKSAQLDQLNQLLQQYHIQCYYVPAYFRKGQAAPAGYDREFAMLLEKTTSCKLMGPDYFLYPNRYFSDPTHLNETGARVYTQALFELLRESTHALQ